MDQFEQSKQAAKIRVVGVGGAGCNAVNTMIASGLERVDFIACNTDVQALAANQAPVRMQIGKRAHPRPGRRCQPRNGSSGRHRVARRNRRAARRRRHGVRHRRHGRRHRHGRGAGHRRHRRELGALTVGVVTKPFIFEGNRRRKAAEQGLQELKAAVDTLITIPNQRLLTMSTEPMPLLESFKQAPTRCCSTPCRASPT